VASAASSSVDAALLGAFDIAFSMVSMILHSCVQRDDALASGLVDMINQQLRNLACLSLQAHATGKSTRTLLIHVRRYSKLRRVYVESMVLLRGMDHCRTFVSEVCTSAGASRALRSNAILALFASSLASGSLMQILQV
jgi:hypothetical protein